LKMHRDPSLKEKRSTTEVIGNKKFKKDKRIPAGIPKERDEKRLRFRIRFPWGVTSAKIERNRVKAQPKNKIY